MTKLNKNSPRKSGGFLLLVVMGLLALLLTLCIGFLVTVRTQTNTVMHQRNRTDLLNIAFSGLAWAEALIMANTFDSNDRMDSSKYVTATYTGSADAFAWYKDIAVNATKVQSAPTTLIGWSGGLVNPKRETKWIYLPSDYFIEGGLRARFAIQILDTNAYMDANDCLEDASPSQAQQAHMWQCSLGWCADEASMTSYDHTSASHPSAAFWRNSSSNNVLYHYNHVWSLSSHTMQVATANKWDVIDLVNKNALSNVVSLNSTYFSTKSASLCLSWSRKAPHTKRFDPVPNSTKTPLSGNSLPIVSFRSYTDPDTGHAPININTCQLSGAAGCGPNNNGSALVSFGANQSVLEGVFNIGAIKRIVKVGSFNSTTGLKYLDPYLYPGNQCFDFDVVTHQVKCDANGIPQLKTGFTPSVAMGANDPATIGTLNPATGVVTVAPGRPRTDPDDTHFVPRDISTEGTVDPATVTIDSIDKKMSYSITPAGSGGRPYVYKSYEDLLALLTTEEQVKLEKLKTKLALQYQETLCRYFVASYANHGNGSYPSTDATTFRTIDNVNIYYNDYYNTYKTWLGIGGDGVTYAVKNGCYTANDYTTTRFPVSVDTFRQHVKADLIAMTLRNNAPPISSWGYVGIVSDGGEYVNFDSAGKPEICAGKLDKRTASAIFDNICPGKRLLFPSEPNIEIKDPIGQIYRRRVGVDEEAINWVEPSPLSPEANVASNNKKRMNNPYDYFLYTEDVNENGVLDAGEDLVKYKFSGAIKINTPWANDPEVPTDPNPNLKIDTLESAGVIDSLREYGREVWCADPANPAKGRDYLTTTGYNRFVDDNIYFNTAFNPVNLTDPAKFDQLKPNMVIHPLPQFASAPLPLVTVKETANPTTIYVKNSNGYWSSTQTKVLSSFKTIEYIPSSPPVSGGADLSNAVDINGDGSINTYYRTPERQLAFGPDSFSTELTTTTVSYKIVVTTELCDAASVDRNAASPIIVAHSEINAVVQLAPDIEGAAAKESASDYVNPTTGASDKPNDPGLHYYRRNQPTIRKTRIYDANSSEIITYNAQTGVKENYDSVKEMQGLQLRGGVMDENSSKISNSFGAEHTSCAREWIDPLGVPDHDASGNKTAIFRNAYYNDPYQNKRRIVVKDLINLGLKY